MREISRKKCRSINKGKVNGMAKITTHYEPLNYRVTNNEQGWTVRDVMHRRMGISRKHLSRLKLTDGVRLNGKSVYVNVTVNEGDFILALMEAEESDEILPQEMDLSILHEDEDLLLLDKPAGLIVHPTHGHYTNTLANGVVYYWRSKGEKFRFRPVHRLDRETSGVILIAKNKHAHHMLSEQWQKHEVIKEYWAIVDGVIEEDQGKIDAPIDRSEEDRKLRVVTPKGYPSVTHYWVERRFEQATWVRLRLETGRTHQIRVHMKHIGHSLIGDSFYGDTTNPWGMNRHALHAFYLQFHHPRNGEWVEFQSQMPADMQSLLDRLSQGGGN
jgi:23S rRNA pseudouridine1911/1915/1917 synthase